MSRSTLEKAVGDIFVEVFGLPVEEFGTHLTPHEVSGWDSIGHLNLMLAMEKELGISLDYNEMSEMDSVDGILLVLEKKLV